MPELPEVEHIRRELAAQLTGATITDVCVSHPGYDIGQLENIVIKRVGRRGKYLELDLNNDDIAYLHLGMTGQLRLGERPATHTHLSINTDQGCLHFRDPRRFGRAFTLPRGERPGGTYQVLGQEPLSRNFNRRVAAGVLGVGTAPIKTRLLAQRAIAGVGNYIADEALHRAGLRPDRREVAANDLDRLVSEVLDVIRESVRAGGVSERDYVHADGGRGSYQTKLRCYGRAGYSCYSCSTPIQKRIVGGRGSTYCPVCQV